MDMNGEFDIVSVANMLHMLISLQMDFLIVDLVLTERNIINGLWVAKCFCC